VLRLQVSTRYIEIRMSYATSNPNEILERKAKDYDFPGVHLLNWCLTWI
jgi:hypothetical protein